MSRHVPVRIPSGFLSRRISALAVAVIARCVSFSIAFPFWVGNTRILHGCCVCEDRGAQPRSSVVLGDRTTVVTMLGLLADGIVISGGVILLILIIVVIVLLLRR